jgi:hypothetical protein
VAAGLACGFTIQIQITPTISRDLKLAFAQNLAIKHKCLNQGALQTRTLKLTHGLAVVDKYCNHFRTEVEAPKQPKRCPSRRHHDMTFVIRYPP